MKGKISKVFYMTSFSPFSAETRCNVPLLTQFTKQHKCVFGN